jgi:protoporphyrinogen/coproporphyrinogen III oxidase
VADSLPALVIGAGISGLACAYALRQSGIDAHMLEAAPSAGGIIQSVQHDGFLLELGPQSFSATTSLLQLCRDLAIADQLVEAPPRSPRFVLIDGVLRPVPLSPPALFSSGFVGTSTKWAILRDACGRTAPPAEEESIAAFVRRKFSPELLEKLVGPFVSGIYAGDPEKLSLRAAFPQLYEAEATAGSVVRGMMRATKGKKGPGQQRPALLSFRDGNAGLPRAIAGKLGSALHLNARVNAIQRSSPTGQFLVSATVEGAKRSFTTENLVLAAPTDEVAALLADVSSEFQRPLTEIEYAPVAVVPLGYRTSDIGRPLDGFGFLVPRSSGLQILGSVWNSSLFPGRTPAGHALLTSFVGGATNPGAVRLSSQQLASIVHRELSPILKIAQPPVFSHGAVYERAIPQYNLGHLRRLSALEATRANIPGLFFAGNYLRGPAIGACVEQAHAVAAQISSRLAS